MPPVHAIGSRLPPVHAFGSQASIQAGMQMGHGTSNHNSSDTAYMKWIEAGKLSEIGAKHSRSVCEQLHKSF